MFVIPRLNINRKSFIVHPNLVPLMSNKENRLKSHSKRKILSLEEIVDPETLQTLQGEIYFPERPRNLGKVIHIHFAGNKNGINQEGLYLPPDDDWLLEKLLSGKISESEYKVVRNIYRARNYLVQNVLYSPGTHYGCSWITGDIGEIRTIKINGQTKEVLVIPQGRLRAETNSSNFAALNMNHPLSDPEKMLKVMALTMHRSEIKTPYFRGLGIADTGNDMALQHPTFSASFVADTWDFFGLPSYKLPRQPKKPLVSPLALEGDDRSRTKVVDTYARRIRDRQNLLLAEKAKQFAANDTAYFIQNGLLSDYSCQNLAFVVSSNGRTKIIFVNGSEGNYFFEGKTQKTVYEVIRKLGMKNCSAAKIQTPEELAYETGYLNEKNLSGRPLTYDILRTKVDGLLAMGTFKGIESCEGILPEKGDPIYFPWPTEAQKQVQQVQDLLWKTVYGLNGGTELTQDLHYCCMFDVTDLQKGIAKPLDLRGATLEDVV